MTNTSSKLTDKEEARNLDVLLVIGSLFNSSTIISSNIEKFKNSASKYITSDFKKIELPQGMDKLNIQAEQLPKLYMQNGGKVISAGSSIVLECWDDILPGRRYALKVPRPSLIVSKYRQKDAQSEAINSAQMTHNNVAYLVGLYNIMLQPPEGPAVAGPTSLFEWVDNSKPLGKYLHDSCRSVGELINILSQVLSGFQHIHEKGFIHWDIKSDNCVVTSQAGYPLVKILDIGNAREKANEVKTTYLKNEEAYTSKENLPPWLKYEDLGDLKDSDRVHITLKKGTRTYDWPWLDLYMFGQMIGRILGFSEECDHESDDKLHSFLQRIFPPKDQDSNMAREFLQIIYHRLTYLGENIDYEDLQFFKEHYYETAREVLNDINKLSPQFGAANDIRELHAVSQKIIRLPITQNTEHSARVKYLINSELFQRLNKHNQLGLTWYVYPGAKHTRFEHSLGTWATTIDYLRALYADRTVPYFRLLCNESDIQAALFAALIHDIGHGAFTHYLEEMASLFSGCDHEDYVQAALRGTKELYDGELKNIIKDHLTLIQCAKVWIAGTIKEKEEISDKMAKNFLLRVADILNDPEKGKEYEMDLTRKKDSQEMCNLLLNSILSGPIDSDKMDYIRRDSHHCGVGYALGADTNRFYQSLSVAVHKPTAEESSKSFRPTVAVKKKGVGPVESLLLSRYQVFNAVYWHHTARIVTNILQYLVWRYIWPPTPPKDGEFGSQNDDMANSLKKRRETLLNIFRFYNDESATKWLEKKLVDLKVNINTYKQVLEFTSPIESLKNRNYLPKRLFDISYAETGGKGRGKEGTKLQQSVLKILCYHQLMNDLSPKDYCKCRENMLFRASQRTIYLAKKEANDAKLKDNIIKELGDLNLNETNYFPDVPLQTKDQVDNLWIIDSNPSAYISCRYPIQMKLAKKAESESLLNSKNTLGSSPVETTPFFMYSPMGEAIKQAFQLWARRVRIFVDPIARDKLQENLGETNASNCALQALEFGYESAIRKAYYTTPEIVRECLLSNNIFEQNLPNYLNSYSKKI